MSWLRALVLVVAMLVGGSALALSPDEILADPVLEQRARDISAGLRCLVCQNQSIDDSDADLAKDLRVLVRERLVAGDSDEAVRQYLVDRYGEFVLYKPEVSGSTWLLWFGPLVLLLAGAAVIFRLVRKRSGTATEVAADDGQEW